MHSGTLNQFHYSWEENILSVTNGINLNFFSHNILVYKRKLTEKEMKSYDLDYLGEITNEQQTS